MNTELRNKLFNKMKNVFENEDTQEREAFLQAREKVDCEYDKAQHLARQVVERAYQKEDVAVLRQFKKKYGFILHTMKIRTRTATLQKQNLILILVCLVI